MINKITTKISATIYASNNKLNKKGSTDNQIVRYQVSVWEEGYGSCLLALICTFTSTARRMVAAFRATILAAMLEGRHSQFSVAASRGVHQENCPGYSTHPEGNARHSDPSPSVELRQQCWSRTRQCRMSVVVAFVDSGHARLPFGDPSYLHVDGQRQTSFFSCNIRWHTWINLTTLHGIIWGGVQVH